MKLTNAVATAAEFKFADLGFPALGALSTYLLANPFAEEKSVTVALGLMLAIGLAMGLMRKPTVRLARAFWADIKVGLKAN